MSNILKTTRSLVCLSLAALLLPAAICEAKSHKPKPSPSPASDVAASSAAPAAPVSAVDAAALAAMKSKDPSELVPPNAGSHGFVKVDPATKRLVFDDGTPARFYGVNFAEYLNEPARKVPTEEMVGYLKDLQAMGVNVIRFQTYDTKIQQGVWGKGINAVALENRDRFIAEAKKLGIYFHMSMNTMDTAHGAAGDIAKPMGGTKSSMIMMDRLIKAQHTFAVNLLNHVNPYTGLAYKDEPAIVSIQLGNEQHTYSRPTWGTWDTLKGAFADELRGKWNRWLVQTYGTRDKLAAAWGPLLKDNEDPTQGTVAITNALYPMWNQPIKVTPRGHDAVLFADYLQDQFYKGMRDCIRNEADDKHHLISDNGWVRGDDFVRATAQKDLDLMDVQHYWPHYDRRRLSAEEVLDVSPIKTTGINILNSLLSAREVNGKWGPGFVTEYNTHKDNQRSFQVVPVHAIMAQLTGIDGAALWTYSMGTTDILFDKDHWFSFNRENSDLTREVLPFIVGAYLWRLNLPQSISQETIAQLAKWNDTNPIGLSVDYDASLKQAVSVKPYANPAEGVSIDFPGDKMHVYRDDVAFFTGSGPIKTAQFDYQPLKDDAPYLLAVFPVDGKPLSTSEEWRVFVTQDGTMTLKRPDLTEWRSASRGYTSTHGENAKGTLASTKWEIKRPLNCLYYDLKTKAYMKYLQKQSKAKPEVEEADQ